MTWYRTLEQVQSNPIDLGLDDSGRQVLGVNFNAVKRASDTFRQEVTTLLVDAGVGTYVGADRDIFRGALAKIPTGAGPYLHLRETGGTSPEKTQNTIEPPAYERPAVQVTVRAASYTAADVMIRAAMVALNIRNQDVAP